MGFTDEQLKAIETRDKSILVSAAAGSGKTTVLIERIIKIILAGEANVDEMLVVTFTNAAASDMKLKLIKALKNEIAKTSDEAGRQLLLRQLNMIYRAYISTFHAFASRVIKEFFHETDVGADFKIADETQSDMLKMEALDETLDACFADDGYISGGSFKEFARTYIDTSDEEKLTEMMLDAYKAIRSMPNYFAWAEDALERLNVSGDYKNSFVCKRMEAVISRKLSECRTDAEYLRNELMAINCSGLAGIVDDEVAIIQAFLDSLAQGGLSDEWFDSLANPGWLTLRAKAGDDKDAYKEKQNELKKIRDSYKAEIKSIPRDYANPSLADSFEAMSEIYDDAKYFIELLKDFERRFDAKKRERQLVDFNDIEHIAVSVLENPDVAEIMRNRFKFIFVDEYQDTNYLQEYLINMIARPNNVFKVGDIKQSIYRFRQSEPEIFVRTAAEYDSKERPDATRIDLNANFRSNGRTINYINAVFAEIMDGYDDRAALHLDSNQPQRNSDDDLIPEVHVLVDQGLEAGTDASIQEWSKNEAEAEYIADIVEGIVGTEFYDGKRGCVRQAKKGDIAILYRGNTPASIAYNVLKNRGIPAHVSNAKGYFDTLEIRVALSLLHAVDNIKKDAPLIATLHSEIFGFTPEELGEVRAYYIEAFERSGRYAEYSDAVKYYAKNGPQEDLRNKLDAALTRISDWHERSLAMPLDDFIWYLLTDSDYYLYAGAMYAGAQRQANLRALVDRARAYRDGDVSSLGDFIRYLDNLQRNDIKAEEALTVSENDDIVRVMTIHKSKGLEFPFVIIGGMGRNIESTKMKRSFFCDHDIGFSLPIVDFDRKFWRPTLMQRLIHDKKSRDEYAEEQRVLYVAMTRAREKLYLVGTVAADDQLALSIGEPSSLNRVKKGSYFNMILPCLHTIHNKLCISDLKRKAFSKNLSTVEEFLNSREKLFEVGGRSEYAEIDRRLGYVYPYGDEVSAKRKLSVSEIRKEVLSVMERDAAAEEATSAPSAFSSREPEFLGTHKYTRAEVGTAYHRIMEFIDFRKAISGNAVDSDYIRERLDKLLVQEAIPAALMDEIDLSKIEPFFESDIGRRACEAAVQGKLYKEKPFTLKWNYQGRDIYVQGVIDCCFEEAGKMVLVDYKSSYIKAGDDSAEVKIAADYAEQISIYKEAVEQGTGMPVSEAYLYLFMTASALKM